MPAEYLASLSIDRHEAMWSENIAEGTPELLVADEGDSILGWVAFGDSRDEDAGPDTAEIWAIYVDSSQWSAGVGRALWSRTLARLQERGFASVGLWAFPANERASRFYHALGFEVDASSAKQFVLGGASLDEVRYVRRIEAPRAPGGATRDPSPNWLISTTAPAPPMKKSIPPASPAAYLESLNGWQHRYVEALRATVIAAAPTLDEVIKWGHLVYFSNGPVLLIRAEERARPLRVLARPAPAAHRASTPVRRQVRDGHAGADA